jgi:NAD(P)-dependent dehydrogenase (short-subunit alcohol dehydrogenase family)
VLLHPIVLDITSFTQIQQAVKQVEHGLAQYEPNSRVLIGIVHTASMPLVAPIESVSTQDWNQIMAVNTIGPLQTTNAFLPLLRHSNGRIVNISSASAIGSPLGGPFAASKMVYLLTRRWKLHPMHLGLSCIDGTFQCR